MKKWKLIFVALFAAVLVGCSANKEEVKNKNDETEIVELSKLDPSQKEKVTFELVGRVFIPKYQKDSSREFKATFDLIITNNSGKKIKYDLSEFKVNNSNLNLNYDDVVTLKNQATDNFASLFSGIEWKKNNKLTYRGVEMPVKSILMNETQLKNWLMKDQNK